MLMIYFISFFDLIYGLNIEVHFYIFISLYSSRQNHLPRPTLWIDGSITIERPCWSHIDMAIISSWNKRPDWLKFCVWYRLSKGFHQYSLPVSFWSKYWRKLLYFIGRRAGSDGSMSASGSAGPGFDPRRGSKFSFENFQPRG